MPGTMQEWPRQRVECGKIGNESQRTTAVDTKPLLLCLGRSVFRHVKSQARWLLIITAHVDVYWQGRWQSSSSCCYTLCWTP